MKSELVRNQNLIDILKLIEANKFHLLKKIEKHRTNLNVQRGESKDTPLMRAVIKGYYRCVKILLSLGARINLQNKEGDTALHLASEREGRAKIINLLLQNGANIDKRNSFGKTALILACASGCKQNVKELLKHSPQLNILTKDHESALTYAIVWKRRKILELLIQAGADVNLHDGLGWFPLDYALDQKDKVIIDNLMRHGAIRAQSFPKKFMGHAP